jgi:hypothetical protein
MIGANDNGAGTANDNEALVISGTRLNESQARRFRQAVLAVASPDLRQRREGREAMLRLEEEIEAAQQAIRVANDIAETVELESLRGSQIETSDRKEHEGRKRIASRDGLETLMTARSLSANQFAAGLRFRTDYELLDPEKGLTPPALDQTRNITRGGEGWAKKRTQRELFVRDLEKLIQEEDRTFKGPNGRTAVERTGRAVWALREIAGKGSNLRSLSNSGSVQRSISEALVLALDCAALAYGLE